MADQMAVCLLVEVQCDGTYDTASFAQAMAPDGSRKHHPTFGHLVAYLALRLGRGDHFYVQGHEDGFLSFAIHDEAWHGPGDHENIRSVAAEMVRCLCGRLRRLPNQYD